MPISPPSIVTVSSRQSLARRDYSCFIPTSSTYAMLPAFGLRPKFLPEIEGFLTLGSPEGGSRWESLDACGTRLPSISHSPQISNGEPQPFELRTQNCRPGSFSPGSNGFIVEMVSLSLIRRHGTASLLINPRISSLPSACGPRYISPRAGTGRRCVSPGILARCAQSRPSDWCLYRRATCAWACPYVRTCIAGPSALRVVLLHSSGLP
jgi:hypothetical protein